MRAACGICFEALNQADFERLIDTKLQRRVIPQGSRSESGTLIGIGPGHANFGELRLGELPRIPKRRSSSQNFYSTQYGEYGRGYPTAVFSVVDPRSMMGA